MAAPIADLAPASVVAGDMSDDMATLSFSVCFVVVILAVTPWDYVRKRSAGCYGPSPIKCPASD